MKLFVLLLSFIGLNTFVFAQNSEELKRRKENLTREIESLNNSLNQTSTNKRLSLKQIQALNAQIRLREAKIRTINSEVTLLQKQISKNTNIVHSLQDELVELKKEYAATIVYALHNKNAYNQLMFIFSSADFNQAYKRLKYLHQINEQRAKRAKYISKTKQRLNVKIVELNHNRKEKDHLLHDEEKEKLTLGKEKNNQTKVLTGLNKQEKKLKQDLGQKRRESARLNRAIQLAINREIEEARRKAEAEERERAKTSPKGTSPKSVSQGSSILAATPESAKLSSDFLGSRGNLPWPVVNGVVMESFGLHRYGANVKTENNGINIKTAVGSSVRAVFAGEVATVQNFAGSYAVLIRHGEYFTVYSNLRSVSVNKGQKVSLKQTIGTVLTNTDDDTTEVHFEIRKGAAPMNPESWLAN